MQVSEEDMRMVEVAWETINDVCYGGELPRPEFDIRRMWWDNGNPRACFSAEVPTWVLYEKAFEEIKAMGGLAPGESYQVQPVETDDDYPGCIFVNEETLPKGTKGGKTRFYCLCESVAHEMVHQYCYVNDIDECDPETQWHNESFRDEAEAHGLRTAFFEDWNGWQQTEFADETVAELYAALPADLRKALLNKRMREYHVNRGAVFVD